MQHRWLCHPPCLPSGRLRRLPRHRRRLVAENSEGPLGAPTGGLARPQGESRLTPAEPENAASVPVGTPSGVVSPLYTDTNVAPVPQMVRDGDGRRLFFARLREKVVLQKACHL